MNVNVNVNGKIIGVDIDLTVVDSVTPWKDWYLKLTGHDLGDEISNVNNDLQALMHKHSDPLSFWKDTELYDDLTAFEDSIRILKKLHSEGYNIVFVSTCFPEHENSKKMFCQRNFPFMSGFISTADKQFVKMDYFIDDYKKNLRLVKSYQPECGVFHIRSDINSKSDEFTYGSWDDFYSFIYECEK